MAEKFKTLAFCLKEDNIGEADKSFVLYTEKFGKIKLIGKGIRKINSKLRQNIKFFSLLRVEFVEGKYFKKLTGAEVIKEYKEIKKDLTKLKIVYFFADVLDNLEKEENREIKIWNLLCDFFRELNYCTSEEDENKKKEKSTKQELSCLEVYLYFLIHLISFLGYLPNLVTCSNCHRKFSSFAYFLLEKKEFVCQRCFLKEQGEKFCKISIEVLEAIKKLFNSNLKEFKNIKFKRPLLIKVAKFLKFYLLFLEKSQL